MKEGDLDPNFARKIVREVQKEMRGGAKDRHESLQKLVDLLEEDKGKRYVYSLVKEEVTGHVKAIFFYDKKIGPKEPPAVINSDCTFGILNDNEGFPKQATTIAIGPNHQCSLMSVGAIQHEDTQTFEAEADFLIHCHPSMDTNETVHIMDGNPVKIAVTREKFPNSIVVLDLYHQEENMKKRLGPIMKPDGGRQHRRKVRGEDQ